VSDSVGPITFSHPVAREQLLENGYVFTFRTQDRTTGKTWARAERLGEKIADVEVQMVGVVRNPGPDALLDTWARGSGFETPRAWYDAICDVHGNPERGFVYHVTLEDGDYE
jgi:hypothetical protein